MLPVRGRVLPVLLAALVLVGGANLGAYAANGHPLLLGHANAESQPASVANTGKGPALSLRSSRTSPPLAVTSSRLVRHLNADSVDGKGAAALQTRAATWTVPSGTTMLYRLDGLAPGRYLATLNIFMNSATTSVCELQEGTTTSVLTHGANLNGLFSMVSGVGLLVHGAGQTLTLNCDWADSISSTYVSTVTLVSLDQVAQGTVAPTPKRPAR